MNKIYYLVLAVLILIIVFLSKSIFFGENNYSKRAKLIEENKMQKIMNEELQKHNEILEFEIKNDHIENFAREKLNLSYEEEEFISFKEENNKDVKDE